MFPAREAFARICTIASPLARRYAPTSPRKERDEVEESSAPLLSGRKRCTPPATHTVVVIRHEALPRRPTGKSIPLRILSVQSCLQKYFAFGVGQIKSTTRAVLSHRGALRNVTNAGQDAVDADALSDEGR
jgi:hypothetical protein